MMHDLEGARMAEDSAAAGQRAYGHAGRKELS